MKKNCFRYDISIKPDPDRSLNIDSIGTITIVKPLDREKYPSQISEAGVMKVIVRAFDKGRCTILTSHTRK
jgi:hypothetical protein